MKMLKNLVRRYLQSTEGATAIEYGLIASGIGLAIVPAIALLGPTVQARFVSFATALATVANP